MAIERNKECAKSTIASSIEHENHGNAFCKDTTDFNCKSVRGEVDLWGQKVKEQYFLYQFHFHLSHGSFSRVMKTHTHMYIHTHTVWPMQLS